MTRATTIVSAIAASLLLAACFLIPGKFASTLDVKRDGAFTFAYKGEIVLVTPASLGQPTPPDTVLPTCFGPVPAAPPLQPGQGPNVAMRTFRSGQRPCTPEETAKRTADAVATRQREGEQMAKIIGLDPSNDTAMRDYAVQLSKQAGWRSATYRGNGVFDVNFEQSGRLDRDFVFPLLPKSSVIVPFVVIRKRSDGGVLVSAPGYRSAPAEAFMNGISAETGTATKPLAPPANGPQGSFIITSDIVPLTNNTEDGPSRNGSRTRLTWSVTPGSDKIPETLIPLGH
ncbi:hypothetical protein [Polymorphobacter megasporae]|uniref:hypothetical protein n=1 Tax=Glacieibacterium megasporae TaxID=2835787 RepID=UPI001C1E6E01|nr:hypothetical protein [Polymorphobacter megasporae]UAJ11705.1 hypothetical protein KTC28_08640 [Polymorphobacter megasporae]